MPKLNRTSSIPLPKAIGHALVASLAILAFGCSQPYNYVFRPAENASAFINGYPAAHYAIPPNALKGDVRVASFGVAEVGHEEGPDLPSLHVRMVIDNNLGKVAWTIDTREVRVELRGEQPRSPAFVNARASSLPLVSVPTGEQRTIDLFYPLPKERDDPQDVPAFDVLWKVQTEDGPFAERTPFEKLEIERVAPVTFHVGYEAYWWYDPWYPGYAILRPAVIVPLRIAPPPRIHVRRPPSWR